MKTSTIWTIILVLILIVGVWYFYFYSGQPVTAPIAPSGTETQGTQPAPGTNGDTNLSIVINNPLTPKSATVKLVSTGFSPATVTIEKGGTVTWVNESGSPMWVASGKHPTHELYAGTSRETHCASSYTGPAPFDQCSSSENYSFTFNKAGTWKYHNHVNTSQVSTVIVQ